MWYKVVRPNMSSFADPSFVYEVGKAKTVEPSERLQLCAPGLLHASRTPEQAARYGQWPYRLFAVKPWGKKAEQDDKAGFLRLTLTEELPVSQCFGPNGVEVLRVVERAALLTPDEAARLATARAARAAWDAWAAAGAAWDAWAAAWAAGDAAWAAWAAWAARDAAGAIAVRDLIGQHGFTQERFDTLVGPWVQVIGKTWEVDDDA